MQKLRRYRGFAGGLPMQESVELAILEHMFDTLAAVGQLADESALVERIAELERIKSAAAAGQARAAAALDAARRDAEGAAGIWALPRPWCTRCRTPWRRWNPGRCRSGVPP